MKRISLLFLQLIFAAAGSVTIAQEVIFPLNVNHALIKQAEKRSNAQLQRIANIDDTLILPFADDFSRPGMYPFDSLWLDSGVYINNNYSELPFTIGIATFDGLDKGGRPYQPAGTQSDIADYLTSRPIDLTVLPGDTTVWFSFFYQPQGLGDEPEAGDSLVLQFKDTSGAWEHIWAVDGHIDTAFQRVNIRITDLKYLFKGFQFRFYNIATLNGNRDHWNLDYIYLNNGVVENDSIRDFSMVGPQRSLLSEFEAMPYPHYKAIGSSAMKTSVDDSIYVINYGPTSLRPYFDISHSGVSIFNTTTPGLITGNPVSYVPYNLSLNSFSYPIQSTDSAEFLVRSYVDDAVPDLNHENDTSYYNQFFHNYYAYDDGSAELGYGLTGNSNVSMAYQFNVKMADTLRGVQIYFNPTGVDVTNKLFQLTVWTDVNVGSNYATQLYRMINQKPDSFIGINGFKTYLFDTLLVVNPGNIWVGMIQNEPQTLYGVGLDRNIDSHNKMFYHVDGNWYQSTVKGSWMIRPLFGKEITLVSVDENILAETKFTLRPNPATGTVRIVSENKTGKAHRYMIFNCLGAELKEGFVPEDGLIDISFLNQGIYFVRLISHEGGIRSGVRKLIVH